MVLALLSPVLLLLRTVKVTLLVNEAAPVYVTLCGPIPVAVAGLAPFPKFHV
jgi:hypothetical protein